MQAWNAAFAGWPEILICPENQCSGKNTDNKKVYIHVVSGARGEGRGGTGSFLDLNTSDCGKYTACVRGRSLLDNLPWSRRSSSEHMGNLDMIIEEPMWAYNNQTGEHTRYWQTDRVDLNGMPYPGNNSGYWKYLPSTIIHEFGHTLGLADLDVDVYPGYAMSNNYRDGVTLLDREYLRQVYRNLHGVRPH